MPLPLKRQREEHEERTSSAREEVLRVEGVSKRFGGTVVLDGMDLRLTAGESLAILGKSGSGKSVFLKIVTGLLEPDAGQLFLWGQPMEGLSEEAWLPFRRRLGVVFQSGALFVRSSCSSRCLVKGVAFGFVIGLIATHAGFKTRRATEEVGISATKTMVQGVLAVLVVYLIVPMFLLFLAGE